MFSKSIYYYLILSFFIFGNNIEAQSIYATSFPKPNGLSTLHKIDIATGAVTTIGSIGFTRCGGMDLDPTTNLMYAACENAGVSVLVRIDTVTGAGTLIGSFGFGAEAVGDISFNSSGQLYLFNAQNNPDHKLYSVNKTTGAATLIGSTGLSFAGGNGIAFNPSNVLIHSNNNNFHNINIATGLASATVPVAFTQLGGNPRLAGMDYHPITGQAYGVLVTNTNTLNYFVSVNPAAGTATTIGASTSIQFDAIAFGMILTVMVTPTLGEWGLFICFLLILSSSSILFFQKKRAASLTKLE